MQENHKTAAPELISGHSEPLIEPCPRVLVVDDFEAGRYSKARLLRNAGFEVVEASTGAEALEIAQQAVCVVLLDVHLPDMSGVDVARRIKSVRATRTLPIIQISAVRTSTLDAVAGLQGGADAYLVDPVDPSLLVATVRSMARARAAELEVVAAAAAWETTFDAISDGVFLVDADGIIERANLAGARIVDQGREALLGKRLEAILRRPLPADPAVAPAPLQEGSELEVGEQTYSLTYDVLHGDRGPKGTVIILRNITRVKKEQQRIASLTERAIRSEEFLHAVTESIATGVYATDIDGRCMFVNPAAEQALGWSAAEMQGQNIHELIHQTHADGSPYPEAECPLLDVRQTGVSVRIENEFFVRRDGTRFPVSCSSAPLHVGGTLAGATVAFHDMSERHRLEAALRARADELEQEGRIKDEFFAMVSHELRTPMTSIVGWTQLLQHSLSERKVVDEQVREALVAIASSASLQDRIIGDMLDLSRIATSKLHLDIVQVDFREILHAVASTFRPIAEGKGLDLIIAADGGGPALVLGDDGRLRQIMSNLLTNAVKFTPTGGSITVAMRADERQIVVSVTDTGVGIAPEFLPRIFQKFAQARAGTEAGGLGLGLAIVRALVEAHRGSVSVASGGAGRGTEFTIRLPRSPHPEPNSPAVP